MTEKDKKFFILMLWAFRPTSSQGIHATDVGTLPGASA